MQTRLKKLLALLLAVVMVISAMPMSVLAADEATYTKIGSIDELTSGKYVMVVETGYAPTVLEGSWILAEAVSASDGKLTSSAANLVWTLTVDGDTVKLTDANGTSIAPKGGNNNGIQSGEYSWKVTCTDGSFQFWGQGSDTVVLASNKGSDNKFRAYKSATVSNNAIGYPSFFALYKLDEGGADPEPVINTIAEAVAGANGESFTVKGVVTLLDGKNIYLQDATGGICLRVNNTPADVALGDTLIGTGSKSVYNGLPQLCSGSYEKSSGLTLSAKETSIGALTTADLCSYIKLSGVEVTEVYDNNGAYSTPNITVTDGSNSIQIYKAVVGKTDGAWDVKVGDKIDVLAAVGCYNATLQLRNTLASEISVAGGDTTEPDDGAVIKDGDKVVIYNPANMMALSTTYNGFYNNGVAVTEAEGTLNGYTDAEIWTVGINDDGSYTFSTADGKKLSMGASYSSMPLDDVNTAWEISDAATEGCYYIKNVVRGSYIEWYAEKNNWSSYYRISDEALFAQKFYVISDNTPEPEEPEITYITKMSQLPEDGDTIAIFNSGHVMGSAASGKKLSGVAATVTDNKIPLDEAMAQLLVAIDEDGNYIFTCEGKYLTSALTGNGLSFADELSDCGKWTLEQVEGADAWYIRNVGANYNGNYNQAMEYYSGFTTYGIKETEIYQMQLFMVEPGKGESGKITSADQLVDGTYVMVVEGGYAPLNLNGNWVEVTQPVISGDVVSDAMGAVWTLDVEGSTVTLTDSNGVSIKPKGGNSNGIASGSYAWSWSFDAATGTFVFAGTGNDTVKLASNASEDPTYGGFHRFRAYKNSTIAGNPSGYPCNFTLYKYETGSDASTLPEEGDQVVIYNLSAEGVLGAENDTQSINNVLSGVGDDGFAYPEDGAVVFTVSRNGNFYRFYNETYGYLCSNGTGNNAFYSQTASEDADWNLLNGKSGGYNMESRTAKFNGTYSQYLEYYGDCYKTYSMYNVTDYDIYEFFFFGVGDGVNVIKGIVSAPNVESQADAAYVGRDWVVTLTVNAVAGIKSIEFSVSSDPTVDYGKDVERKTISLDDSAVEVNGNVYTITVPAASVQEIYDFQLDKLGEEDIPGICLDAEIVFNDESSMSYGCGVDIVDEPSIGEVTPAAGSETHEDKRPVISAEISNAGEEPTIVMSINDEEVEFTYADGVVSYQSAEDMEDARYTVKVTVTRADGKSTEKVWAFTVGEAQYQLYFGQLHSHTTYSDGSGSLESALAYMANLPENANVDFVAFTDHSNYFDKSGAANPEDALYDPSLMTEDSKKLWDAYTGAMFAFNKEYAGQLVAIPGFEMTWSGGPGHINTFNTAGIVSRNNSTLNNKTADAGMKAYYALLSQAAGVDSISQFNHPGTTFGNFTDFAYWDAVVDSRIFLLEVGNGEGQIGAGGYFPSYEQYVMALDKGWHVSPTNNQDNHKGKWGNANDARDVIITDDFSLEGLYAAIRAYRVYATEDKNLEITYTVNDLMLGSSITEIPESLTLDVTVFDPDSNDSISKVEVVVNSGKVAHTWSDPADLADGALTVTLAPDYSYYFIRVTEGDGDIAVTAPVWVGESLKLGISSVICGTSTPVTDEELTITTTLFNSETVDARVKSLTYTVGSEVIGTDTTGYSLGASSTLPIEFKWTPTAAKITTVTVTAVVEQEGKEFIFTMDVELDVQDASKLVYIGIDASHYNEYVNGNYKDSMGNFGALAAGYNVRTVTLNTSEELIAACSNSKYVALILTAPSRRLAAAQADPKVYTEAELAAIKAFNENGGTVILAGWSDNYENYDVIQSNPAIKHMAETQNDILIALGSSLRIGDDATYDDVRSAADGVDKWRLYFNTYGDSFLTEGVEVDPDHPYDRMYTEVFSHYGGATVYTVDGSLPATVNPIVYAHASTYSVDVDKDGLGGGDIPKYEYAEGDSRLIVMASEQLEGRGLIIVSGAAFMSNFEVQATIEDSGSEKNYSNYKICENLLANLNPVSVSTIAEVRAQTEVGYKYTIEGVVTSNASGYDKDTAFFDCIYVQDATGGICCFPVAGNYKIGDLVRITGTTEFYQGEPELQVSSIEVIGSGSVEPTAVTAKQVNDREVEGMLITVTGIVESFEYANELVQTIMVKDENGETVRVFIDGYITISKSIENLAVGAKITVTGLASYDDTFNAPEGPFPRIRIRDRADIVCEIIEYTLTLDANGGEVDTQTLTVFLGEAVGELPVPTRTGYTFLGWFDEEGNEVTAETVYSVAADSTVTAKWQIIIYTVSFDSNGGSAVEPQSVNYGETATEPAEPTREGYAFVGWYLDGKEYDFSAPVYGDLTLVAEWNMVFDVLPDEPDDPVEPDEPDVPDVPDEPELPFIDVDEDDWFYEGICDVYFSGIMNGISEEYFAPGLELSRAMLATMLYRLSGEEYSGEAASFEDVAAGQWYSEAIAWAAANGIVNGVSATQFKPEDDVTREQAATMLYRYAQYKGYDVSVGESTDLKAFADAGSVSAYAVAAMKWAVGAGIINGVGDNTLAPTANSTRAQAATMFSRFMSWCEAE